MLLGARRGDQPALHARGPPWSHVRGRSRHPMAGCAPRRACGRVEGGRRRPTHWHSRAASSGRSTGSSGRLAVCARDPKHARSGAPETSRWLSPVPRVVIPATRGRQRHPWTAVETGVRAALAGRRGTRVRPSATDRREPGVVGNSSRQVRRAAGMDPDGRWRAPALRPSSLAASRPPAAVLTDGARCAPSPAARVPAGGSPAPPLPVSSPPPIEAP
jgi:hypothetical protein